MHDSIVIFREFLLKHFKSPFLQTLIKGLISYEMISYLFFGIGTSVIDYVVFTTLNVSGLDSLITNIISTFCAIIFAYVTNKLWVFKSKTNGFVEVCKEFFKFAYARLATLIMTECILYISQILYGDNKAASQIAKLISMVLTVVLNYIFSKLFIFKDRKGNNNESQQK